MKLPGSPLHLAVLIAPLLLGLSSPSATAADGPGFPNIDRPAAESGTVLSMNDPGKAISSVVMHRGYLFVPLGADHGGGQGDGAFAFYDISDPSAPVSILDSRDHPATYHDSGNQDYVGNFAELHHIPVSGDLVMVSERRVGSAGFSILDLAPLYDEDPSTLPTIVGRYSYPGVTSPTNYDGYSFALAWQGSRYLWGPTGSNGLMIVDTSDPTNPQHLTTIPRSQLGNLSHRQAIAIGNRLILSTAAVGGNFDGLILDISDPANPQQLGTFSGPMGYQPFMYGGKFYGGTAPLIEHDIRDPQNITATTLHPNPVFNQAEYGFGKDDHLFIGHYPGMTKWQLNGGSATLVETVESGIVDDHAFLSPIGPLIAVTSDHNNDRKLILGVHDHQQDTTPPTVNFASPADGETNVHVKSRVGLCFTDFIDPVSVDASNFIVRELGGAQVAGTYSALFGIVNFAPDADLDPDTTYEVVLAAEGVADQSGNANPAETIVGTFSTGAVISRYAVSVLNDDPVTSGTEVTITLDIENSTGLGIEHSWNFGDGTPATRFAPSTSASHTFSAIGNHLVTVSTRFVGNTSTTQATAVQVVHAPIAATPPANSSTIVHDDANQRVWTVNPDNASVTAIDSVSSAKLSETPVGGSPKSLALAPGNQLWVVNKDDATISVIARAGGSVTATHPLPDASAPHAVVVDAAAGVAYVSLEATGEVAKLALGDGSLLGLLDVGPTPHALSLDPSRDRLWVARFISPDASGRMTAIDTTSFTVASVAELAPVMEPDSLFNGRGLPNYLGSVAISPDLTQAYIPSKKDNIFRGLQRNGLPLTFEHTVRSMATRLDLAGGVEDPTGLIDFDNNDFATAAAFSPLGNLVFFTTNGSANVWVVDAYDPGNVFAFDSGGLAPDGLAINADGTRLFVHNFMSRDITVFSIGAPCSGFCGAAPLLDTVGTVASEVLTPQVLLGKQLFYDSSDPRLSQESYMSCASCHLDGSHDGRVWDFTDVGEGLRNTIDLRGRGHGHGPLHWSANFDEVQDFEGQIRHLAGGSGLMANADFHAGTRSLPLGTRKAGVDGGLDALAAYLATLTTTGESPHRDPGGTLTPDALAGRQIFIAKNCASCHTGDAFTDSPSLARHDVGTLRTSSGNRLGGTLDGFDTPTLRGLWQTAPYLHDGSASTLREVLVDENLSGKHGMLFDLSPTEVDQLVAYLEQIDDTEPTAPAAGTNQAPVLPALADQITPSSHPFQLVVAATDGDGDPLTYSATGLPPGLALDPVTGILAGTPGLPGIHAIHLGVRDPFGGIDSTDFDLEVADSTKTLADISPPLGPYRYVKLTALSEANGNPWASMAEFHLLDANLQPIDRSGWSASASSAETSAEDGSPARAIDGLASTIWHTEWSGSPDPPHPHDFIVDLGEPTTFSGMTQLPRSGSANGRIIDYEFSASNDGSTWIPIDSGSFPNATGTHTATFVSTSHGITREWWSGFTGTTVAELESWPAYPDSPDGSELLATADAPQNVDDSYGSRLHGFLVPPVTGTYRFAIASDDASALFLSSDHYATGLDKIAEVTGYTDPLDWVKSPGQQSVSIALEAGKLYYMRALHVEIEGNDHVTIARMTPGSGTFEIIPSSALLPYASAGGNSPPAFIDPPAPATVTLPEDAPVGTVVINPVAWDPDSGQTLSFHIAAGSGPFSIDPTSGVITTSAPLDFEVQTSHEILVEVRDDHATPLSATFALTVNVTNVLESNNEVVLFALTGPGGAFPGHGNPSLIGFAEDPDGDGIPNAIELLYGTLPDVPNHPNPIRMSTIDDGGETYVTYEVDIAKDLDGTLAFDFLGSGDLQAWQVPANPPELVGETATHRTYRIRDDIPLANADRRFLRIRVIP